MNAFLSPDKVLTAPSEQDPREASQPSFPYDAFVGPGADMAMAVQNLRQAAPEIPFLCAFSCVSALCGKSVTTHNERSGHTTMANTFIVLSTSTTEGKGVGARPLVAPLHEMEKHTDMAWSQKMNALRNEGALIEKTRPKARSPKDAERLAEIARELEKPRPRWIASSPTLEALKRNMSTYDEVALLFSTEGQSFMQIATGKFTKGHDSFGELCSMFSGDRISDDRVGRVAPSLFEPTLTLCLMAQPELARQFRCDKAKHVGFLNRTFWPIPSQQPSIDSEATVPALSRVTVDGYTDFVTKCYARFTDPLRADKTPSAVPMSEDAQLFIRRFQADEQRRKSTGDLDAEAHGRGPELVTRAALVFHVMRHGADCANHELTLKTVQDAKRLHDWCQAPWLAADRDNREDEDTRTLRKLRDHIKSKSLLGLGPRDIQRALHILAQEERALVERLTKSGKLTLVQEHPRLYVPCPESPE